MKLFVDGEIINAEDGILITKHGYSVKVDYNQIIPGRIRLSLVGPIYSVYDWANYGWPSVNEASYYTSPNGRRAVDSTDRDDRWDIDWETTRFIYEQDN